MTTRIILTVLLMKSGLMLGQPGPHFLESLVSSSDAIVVAEIYEVGTSATIHTISVTPGRTIKGNLITGKTIMATYAARPLQRQASDALFGKSIAVVFLKHSTDGSWEMRNCQGPGRGMMEAFWPVVSVPVSTNALLLDKVPLSQVIVVLADGAESGGKMATVDGNILKSVVPPALAEPIYRRWMESANPSLREIAYECLVALNDISVLTRAAAELGPQTAAGERFSSALLSWRNTDAVSIGIIGAYVTANGASHMVAEPGSEALARVHSADTLPFLYLMLISPHARVRENAVRGFSAFAAGVRAAEPGLDEAQALDEVMNPGRKRQPTAFDTPETRKYMHFGPFSNSAEEQTYTSFWRTWYESNRGSIKSR
jgi:hypothetical protein